MKHINIMNAFMITAIIMMGFLIYGIIKTAENYDENMTCWETNVCPICGEDANIEIISLLNDYSTWYCEIQLQLGTSVFYMHKECYTTFIESSYDKLIILWSKQ